MGAHPVGTGVYHRAARFIARTETATLPSKDSRQRSARALVDHLHMSTAGQAGVGVRPTVLPAHRIEDARAGAGLAEAGAAAEIGTVARSRAEASRRAITIRLAHIAA